MVPDIPNADTAAIRRSASHGRLGPPRRRRVPATASRGFGACRCRWAGTIASATAWAARMSPTTPAAASRWPSCVFAEATCSGASPAP
ncbi:MAG: hypothetical protein R3F59_13740 [Myxococcota bacterium]